MRPETCAPLVPTVLWGLLLTVATKSPASEAVTSVAWAPTWWRERHGHHERHIRRQRRPHAHHAGQQRPLSVGLPWRPADYSPYVSMFRPTEYSLKTSGHKTMYLAELAFGSSGQTFRLLVDTGSSALVVPGRACRAQNSTVRKCFDPNSSTPSNRTLSIDYGIGTVKGLIVSDEVCLQAVEGRAGQAVSLAELPQDSEGQVRTGSGLAARSGVCSRVSFLVADDESPVLAQMPFDGILGLGLSDKILGGEFSLIENLAAAGRIHGTAFTLRLGNSGQSQLLLRGADDASYAGNHTLWVPLSKGAGAQWQISIVDFTFEGKAQGFGGFEALVDSGTSRLAADDVMQQWLIQRLQPADCLSVDRLPVLGLLLHGGAVLPFFPSDYVDNVQGDNGWPKCKLALMPGHFRSVNGQRLILGDSFLRRYATTFDGQGRQLGFGVDAADELAHLMLPAMFPAISSA